MKFRRISCYFLAAVAVGVGVFPDRVTSQISSDGTLSTTVSTDDAVNFLIENGDISGSNLFHSFLEFSIPNLGSAYFNDELLIVLFANVNTVFIALIPSKNDCANFIMSTPINH